MKVKIVRKPDKIECLYLDFDGFFASVMQQAIPKLRGRPVGVIPFGTDAINSTSVIACSKEAKARGCSNVMRVTEAKQICPEIIFVPQRPDLYRRAHQVLLNEIACELPVTAIKSIDELTCELNREQAENPHALAHRIKQRIAENVGRHITCSIGFGANRLLAKIACKVDKPNGVTVWHPEDMPTPLVGLPLSDIPGIGRRLERRLMHMGVGSVEDLLKLQPKHMRHIWKSVHGESLWYALRGYAVKALPTSRSMYGHGRVLHPAWRNFDRAQDCSRLLLTKAVKRMRSGGYQSSKLFLWLSLGKKQRWSAELSLPNAHTDRPCLKALQILWEQAKDELSASTYIMRVGVALGTLSPIGYAQLDLFDRWDDESEKKWSKITYLIDNLNSKFGKRVLTIGFWDAPPGGFAGGKIAYTRIPDMEDFW